MKKTVFLIPILCATFAGMSCLPHPPPQRQLATLYKMAGDEQWRDLLPGIKDYLLRSPANASAHWLLARAYLQLYPEKGLGLAEGELCFARRLAKTDPGGIHPGAESQPQFEARICAELAQAQVLRAQIAVNANMPPPYIRALVQHAHDYVNQGLAADPNDTELNETSQTLRDFLESMDNAAQ